MYCVSEFGAIVLVPIVSIGGSGIGGCETGTSVVADWKGSNEMMVVPTTILVLPSEVSIATGVSPMVTVSPGVRVREPPTTKPPPLGS
jgi:hypothetical protein